MENQEKVKLFTTRTNKHIVLVQEYANKIANAFPKLNQVVVQAKSHDASKLSNPEYDAYVELTWYYNQKQNGTPIPYKKEWDDIFAIHVKNNSHHPEHHDPIAKKKSVDDSYVVDASSMPMIDMAEMAADLCAMSAELGGTPEEFFNNNINKRWKFTDEQINFMIKIFNEVWNK